MTLGPLMVDVAGTELSADEREVLQHPAVGSVILFSRNYRDREQLTALTASIRELRKPSLLIAVDQEGGRVQRFRDGFTVLPAARAIGRAWELDQERGRRLASALGWLMAAELLDCGVDFSFAPVADLDHGVSEVIGDRAWHSVPDGVGALSLACMQGMRRAGMAAVAKHFPGHGAVVADSHHELPEDRRELPELLDDIAPYRTLIEDGLPGVMMAHVRYPRIDAEIASVSPYWMREQLRGRLGFKGAIFSDDMHMAAAEAAGSMPERVARARAAGADIVLICNSPDEVAATLADAPPLPDPVAHGRLVAMRGHARRARGTALADDPGFGKAVALLAELERPPELNLSGNA